MRVWSAPRRVIDAYIAIIEGFEIVPGPGGPILAPAGIYDAAWPRQHGQYGILQYVPEFCRDWGTGGPILDRHGIYPRPWMALRQGARKMSALETGLRMLVARHYGATLPDEASLFIDRQASKRS